MKNIQKGFTLIELMIVVAIIAILAAIAIPAYQDYTIRSQVTEGLSLADGAKTAVAEYYTNRGTMPQAADSNASVGLAAAASIGGSYAQKVQVGQNGVITVTYGGTGTFGKKANKNLSGATLELSPITGAGSIAWSCRKGATTPVAPKYLPSSCR
ncbi:type IV pilus assembly protein PilA [Luteibacter sp. UNC138MFCol5.1]|uniref:pilin n=1 Tax=Luteibacter sp. UNC138MFCol5.1 TaxID=1502774 RepID=UPI0008B031CA|nr:pilin [Luteibacter sp. UNC138MFCol5.1]SEO84572.1 type IV pilus assembly protein PilA [Luteibacter sp. UNC138MFCol5.1]